MAAKDIAVKKHVVRLSALEREQLQALARKGKGPARLMLKARILLKADVSEGGQGGGFGHQRVDAPPRAQTTGGRRVRDGVEPQPVHAVRAARGWRHIKVTDRHTAIDYAHVLKERRIADKQTLIDEIAA
jgi:hypothetical protein